VGDRLHVSYTRGRKGTLTAGAVTDTPGADRTPVARQITAVSPPST
jgi:hypothetical protein